MTLIHNERTKLLANALDRASTACVAVGLIGPMVSTTMGPSPTLPPWVSLLFWIYAAVSLHVAARVILGNLRS